LKAYRSAKSTVEKSSEELIATYPELRGMAFADTQDALETVLQQTGMRVEMFFQNVPNTSSVEKVRMEWLDELHGRHDNRNQSFHY
jgi:hypothetical protein